MNDELTLQFDPFEGDFGGPGDKVFSNRMVVVRKSGPCAHCAQTLLIGERARSQQSKFDGDFMSHRWCALCCSAMATYQLEAEDEAREALPTYEIRAALRERPAQNLKDPQ